ncbi:MAG: zinc ABC transporter ATP-binding protein ZnuC [Proteobacteria bacterium]|nr:zinc ABC transporter ATP-binding protein ZnuC [Pseudomonadota bacterium]
MSIGPAPAQPAPRGGSLVEARGIYLSFGATEVLSDAGLTVREGEVVTLIGPNGAGKTTLIRVLLGLLRPDAGTVWLRPGLSIGYVPQNLSVDPVLPLSVGRFLDLARRPRRGSMEQALAEVGAGHTLDLPLQTLSGGETRRVLLARALLGEPDLLVLDEPVQGVDLTGQAELYGLIGRIRHERRLGVLLVSHDLHLVMAATDEVICLNHHVCCAGRPETVSRHPEYIALFGPAIAQSFAVYAHAHDHEHDAAGRVIAAAGPEESDPKEAGADEKGSGRDG